MAPHVVVPHPPGPSSGRHPFCGTASVPDGHLAVRGWQIPSASMNTAAQPWMPTSTHPSVIFASLPAGHLSSEGRHTPSCSTKSAAHPVRPTSKHVPSLAWPWLGAQAGAPPVPPVPPPVPVVPPPEPEVVGPLPEPLQAGTRRKATQRKETQEAR